ncbi:MAG TPA: lipopolysaccharide biosynthesis protein [Crocinitomicaceae bacterium]|nr:lipopolysaccharide biosynthesis protein [Crocinitomicaceae bacterium]
MLGKFLKNDFVKSVSVLMTGTVFSQVINYAFTPVLSRIYSVEEMADLNLFFRITGFIIGFATLRYEMSLPLPKHDYHSFLLYRVAVKIAIYTMVLVGIVGLVYIFSQPFSWFNIWFLAFVVIGSIFSIMINLGTNWSIRNNTFHLISQSRIINALSSNVLRLFLGLIHWGSFGLLLGTVVGYVVSSWRFLKEYLNRKNDCQHAHSKAKQYVLVKEYKQFPLINMPHSLSDLGRDLALASLIVLFYGKETFGHYSYTILILNIPIAIIGVAISQAFFNKASKDSNEGKSIYPLVKKGLTSLFLISIIPFTILYFFSEQIFVIVLGEKWRMAGIYASALVLYNFFNFLTAPLGSLALILNRQKEFFISALINSVGQILVVACSFYLLHWENQDFIRVLWLLAVFQSVMMLVNIVLYLHYSKKGKK